MQALALALVGLGAGAFGVIVGAGGGVIMAPVLLLFFDIDPAEVAGTSLGLVALNSFAGAVAYSHMRLVDRRSGLLFAAAAIPGSVGAPFAVAAVAPEQFRAILGALLVALAVHMLVRRTGAERRVERRAAPKRSRIGWRRKVRHVGPADRVYEYDFNEGLAVGFNALLGFVSTFLGTGGGFIRTPVLVAGFGFPVRIAIATSVFSLAIYATAGAVVHAGLGHVVPDLRLGGCGLSRRQPGWHPARTEGARRLDNAPAGGDAHRDGRLAPGAGRRCIVGP